MHRKAGSPVLLEAAICRCAATLRQRGTTHFHGYEIARHLRDIANRRLLTAYGTLYRALSRLEQMGLLESRWEDPQIAAQANRPGRRLYTLTALGETAAAEAITESTPSRRTRRRVVPV